MKTLENRNFSESGEGVRVSADKELKTYMEILLFAVLQPEGQGGFSPAETFEIYKLVDKYEEKTGDEIEIEDADFEKLKKAFLRLKGTASREMAKMYEYINSL